MTLGTAQHTQARMECYSEIFSKKLWTFERERLIVIRKNGDNGFTHNLAEQNEKAD